MDKQANVMDKEWRQIKGFEGIYEISNYGEVKSLERKFTGGKGNYNRKEKILKTTNDKDGYPYVVLLKNKARKTVKVHRLVATAFIENNLLKEQVNHRDGIKSNSRSDNLEWCTQSENQIHSFRILKNKPSKANLGKFGKYSTRAKPIYQLDLEGKIIKEWDCATDASRELKISVGNISSCANGNKNYSHAGGFRWKRK